MIGQTIAPLVCAVAAMVIATVVRGRQWAVVQAYGPYWAGAEHIDGDESLIAEFYTRRGARRWARRHGDLHIVRLSDWDEEHG